MDTVVVCRKVTVVCVCVYLGRGLNLLFGGSETTKQLGFSPLVA